MKNEWTAPDPGRVTLLERLAIATADMRAAQNAYFAGRSPERLRASVALERQVDALLAQLKNGQTTMELSQ